MRWIESALINYLWDYENHLLSALESSGASYFAAYSQDGLVQRTSDGTSTVNKVWDGQNLLQERIGNLLSKIAQYTDFPGYWGGLSSQRRGGTSGFYGFDSQSSSRVLVSIGGAVTDSYSYKAFGEELASGSGTVNPYRYVGAFGYFRNSASRYYVRARHLEVTSERWISRDPIGFDGDDWNAYRDVGNNSLTFVDPSGLICSGFSITTKCPKSTLKIDGVVLENSARLPINESFTLEKDILKPELIPAPSIYAGKYRGKAQGDVFNVATYCCDSDEEAKQVQIYQWYSGYDRIAQTVINYSKDTPDTGSPATAFPYNRRTLVRTSANHYKMFVYDAPGLGNNNNPKNFIISPASKFPRIFQRNFRTCVGKSLSDIKACSYWLVYAFLGIRPSKGDWRCSVR